MSDWHQCQYGAEMKCQDCPRDPNCMAQDLHEAFLEYVEHKGETA